MDFTKLKVLVIGDVMLDEYVDGTVTRISPEAPVPILNKQNSYYRLGGATNVAKNVKALGANVWLIGRIGNDVPGAVIKHELQEAGIISEFLMKDCTLPTTVKTRFMSGQYPLLRVDSEDKKSVGNTPFAEDLLASLDRHMRYFDVIIISDYEKGVVFPELLKEISLLQSDLKKIVTADTHKTDMSLFKNFTSLKPNQIELSRIVKQPVENWKDAERFVEFLIDTYGFDNLLVTLGADGLYYGSRTEKGYLPAEKRDIIDVTGAGDTVIAVYSVALAAGYTIREAAKLANKAAGIVVSKLGTATISIEELLNG